MASSVTVGSDGEVTIPRDVRERFGIEPGHRLVFYALEDGRLGIRVRGSKPSSAYGILKTYGEGLDEAALRDAVGEAVAEGVAERFGARSAKGSGNRGE